MSAIAAAAVLFVSSRGYTLYYGDAEAHLNIARRIVDSRTPGYEQIGTVWLPLPHLLALPFVRSESLWQTGLAGAIPGAACFVLAGLFLFLAARTVFSSGAAGFAAAGLLALNPNLLYLQAAPMTEPVLMAALCALLYFTVRFRATQSLLAAAGAGLAALAATMTRYEGWFLIPFVAGYFLLAGKNRRVSATLLFSLIAALGPLFWFAHNWWWYGNALEFYNGPYSAKAIYARALRQGMAPYPGDHDWVNAWLQFRSAAVLGAGTVLCWIGVFGIAAALLKRVLWPLLFVALPAAFYLLSMYSSGTPIFVPYRWPNSYYNTRYGLVVLPALAFSAAALVSWIPKRFRGLGTLILIGAAVTPWIAYPKPDNWVCWKESQVNSESRRAWTREAAHFLRAHYRRGDGILTSFGDLTGIFRQAGIPLRETLHEGNVNSWELAVGRPEIFLREHWIVGFSGDKVTAAAARMKNPSYDCVLRIVRKGGPVVEVYRRQ